MVEAERGLMDVKKQGLWQFWFFLGFFLLYLQPLDNLPVAEVTVSSSMDSSMAATVTVAMP
jgi:hypothetical protein